MVSDADIYRSAQVMIRQHGIGAALSGGQGAIAVLVDHDLGRAEYVGV
jgi:hypothetical protein